jgi:Na+/H+ antiporter NhaD/arsenite permease-like protein
MEWQAIVAIAAFALVYLLLVTERLPRTDAALLGAAIVVLAKVFPKQSQALAAVDFNTLGLLVGMMIIVNIIKRTGAFQWLGRWAVIAARAQPWRLLVYLFLVTALASAFLDNVTTVLFMAPITLSLAQALRINPRPYLIAEILASNIGGTATLIGDPPNIIIGSQTGLSFLHFVLNLAPLILLVSPLVILFLWRVNRHALVIPPEGVEVARGMTTEGTIKDYPLLRSSLSVLGLVIVGFLLHGWLGYEAATVAMAGATLLVLITPTDLHQVLAEIEWPTIFFFAGLFVLVGAVEHTGLLAAFGHRLQALTDGNVALATILLLWASALLSALVDNIPTVMALVPVVKVMSDSPAFALAAGAANPFWWALALGACLGGNGTLVGASANVVVAGTAAAHGQPIGFRSFLREGIPVTLITIVAASVYLWLRYLL